MTWLGGADWVPKACRRSDSTITMRVKPVIINSTAGINDRAVKNNRVWMGTEKFIPPCPLPTSSGSWPGTCAAAEKATKPNAAPRTKRRLLLNEVTDFTRISVPDSRHGGLLGHAKLFGRGCGGVQALNSRRAHAQNQPNPGICRAHFHRYHPLLRPHGNRRHKPALGAVQTQSIRRPGFQPFDEKWQAGERNQEPDHGE